MVRLGPAMGEAHTTVRPAARSHGLPDSLSQNVDEVLCRNVLFSSRRPNAPTLTCTQLLGNAALPCAHREAAAAAVVVAAEQASSGTGLFLLSLCFLTLIHQISLITQQHPVKLLQKEYPQQKKNHQNKPRTARCYTLATSQNQSA